MTPDDLRKLADEATPLTQREMEDLATYRVVNQTEANNPRAEAFDRANEQLERMAPDLARLCAEFAITNRGFDAALAKLSSLEPQ